MIELADSDVLKMLQQLCRTSSLMKELEGRKLTLFKATSYGSDDYRVYMFYVEGSPPRAIGWIEDVNGKGLCMCATLYGSSTKRYYFGFDLTKTTARKIRGY